MTKERELAEALRGLVQRTLERRAKLLIELESLHESAMERDQTISDAKEHLKLWTACLVRSYPSIERRRPLLNHPVYRALQKLVGLRSAARVVVP